MPRRAANCTGVVGRLRHRVATRKVARLMAVACSPLPPVSNPPPPPPTAPRPEVILGDGRGVIIQELSLSLCVSVYLSLTLSACLPHSVSLSACLSLSDCPSLNASIEPVNSISVLIYAIISMWPSVSVKFGLGLPTCFFGSSATSATILGTQQVLSPFLTGRMFVRPNILRTLRRTMIRFLIEHLLRRIWFGQSKLYFILNWLVMRCKLRPELAADAQQTAWWKCRLKSSQVKSVYFNHPSQGNSTNYYLILGSPRQGCAFHKSTQVNK